LATDVTQAEPKTANAAINGVRHVTVNY
jgi:hypothetical protein